MTVLKCLSPVCLEELPGPATDCSPSIALHGTNSYSSMYSVATLTLMEPLWMLLLLQILSFSPQGATLVRLHIHESREQMQ